MAAPIAPTNLSADPQSTSKISLTWNHDPTWFGFDGNDGSLGGFDEGRWYTESAQSINIYRSGASESSLSDYTKIDSVSGSITSYDDTGLSEDKEYYYRVTAVDSDGESDLSNEDSGTTYIDVTRSVQSSCHLIESGIESLLDLLAPVSSYSSTLSASSKRKITVDRGIASLIGTISSSNTRSAIDFEDRIPSSYLATSTDSVTTVIKIGVSISSNATQFDSNSTRVIDLNRDGAESHASSISTSAELLLDLILAADSHSKQIRSSVYNDRTSLELVDYKVIWNGNESVWYTPWVNQEKILGSEESFVIRGNVIKSAKEPTAMLVIQHDSTGNGIPDNESEFIFIGRDEQVKQIHEVPIIEGDNYRMKIMEYSGYNSLYSLDMAFVHS